MRDSSFVPLASDAAGPPAPYRHAVVGAVVACALLIALLALTVVIRAMTAEGSDEDWLYAAAALAWLVIFAGLLSTLLHLLRR